MTYRPPLMILAAVLAMISMIGVPAMARASVLDAKCGAHGLSLADDVGPAAHHAGSAVHHFSGTFRSDIGESARHESWCCGLGCSVGYPAQHLPALVLGPTPDSLPFAEGRRLEESDLPRLRRPPKDTV